MTDRTDRDDEDPAEQRNHLAEQRTDFAEDRTLMANERTFAGWMRTGLAAVGIGLGFNALFGTLEPWWLPRAIATAIILTGIFIFWTAQHHGCRVYGRLSDHAASPLGGVHLRTIALILGTASLVLIAGIWLMSVPG